MNLYLITRNDHVPDWEYYDSMIVAAETENQARLICPDERNQDGWKNRTYFNTGWVNFNEVNTLTVKLIGTADPEITEGVVLSSYQNG